MTCVIERSGLELGSALADFEAAFKEKQNVVH